MSSTPKETECDAYRSIILMHPISSGGKESPNTHFFLLHSPSSPILTLAYGWRNWRGASCQSLSIRKANNHGKKSDDGKGGGERQKFPT